ncbi:glycerophosphodiester phosphodiesterase family protein [Leucobacter triazinivorans]|uniref:Glycerophosphodiester phosphodiesterase n=1 Tax=Leucobacter triazinivorans TaxID=1784719 RepID=A0A4P6KBU3_9MICO|nr:glycerophosphodiester phosphodiesterase family protein [Leucobacter triazinivorans]QBE47765.1 glycerophosphodiester phosphodiesterase [Leucobacter triazinivorans]
MTHPYLTAVSNPKVLAHRGFVSEALVASGVVENTRVAFASAVLAGADYLETDCRLTRDGRVVLCHDGDLARVTGDPQPVASATHRDLAAMLADRGGLLTLEEALEEFPNARFNVDVKVPDAAEAVGRCVAPHAERVLVTSFSEATRLRTLRASAAVAGSRRPATSPGRRRLAAALAAIALRSRAGIARACAGVDALQIPERQGPLPILSPRLLDETRRLGIEVHVWTVNDPQRMRELVRMGVSGVITDCTDLALDALP